MEPSGAALVWLSEETLTLDYGAEPLACDTVVVDRTGQLSAVTEPRLVRTRHQSQQPWLWELSPEEWLLALRHSAPRHRQRRRAVAPAAQLLCLFDTAAFAAPHDPVTEQVG